jgi:hypothetical protein
MITEHLPLFYMVVLLFLLLRLIYLYECFVRFVYEHYPKEGEIVRKYQYQCYPWSKGQKALRALVREKGDSDDELAKRAKKVKHSRGAFLTWFALGLLAFAVMLILHLIGTY